jgi:predicted DNA-binding transcriptional regulator AlpA
LQVTALTINQIRAAIDRQKIVEQSSGPHRLLSVRQLADTLGISANAFVVDNRNRNAIPGLTGKIWESRSTVGTGLATGRPRRVAILGSPFLLGDPRWQPKAREDRMQIIKPNKIRAALIQAQAPLQRLLSGRQLAHFLGVSPSWVNKSRVYGTGPVATKVGNRVRYDIRDVEAWLLRRKQQDTSHGIGSCGEADTGAGN